MNFKNNLSLVENEDFKSVDFIENKSVFLEKFLIYRAADDFEVAITTVNVDLIMKYRIIELEEFIALILYGQNLKNKIQSFKHSLRGDFYYDEKLSFQFQDIDQINIYIKKL